MPTTKPKTDTTKAKPTFTSKARALKTKFGDKVKGPPREKTDTELEHERRARENEMRKERGL
jgi:hypothetical protein